jgi:hypothetical protein
MDLISPLNIAAIIFAILSITFLITFIISLKKHKKLKAAKNFIFMLFMLVISLLFATISFSLQGYNSLIHEELAAYVDIEPTGKQSFTAYFLFPDNTEAEFQLAGDELYVDAHILKWKSVANLFGLHTLYELDRVSGRYVDLKDETTKDRTIYSLASDKFIDIFSFRLEHEFLSFLVDAEYGSATFVNVKKDSKLKIMVSSTGLLIRSAE